MQRGTVGAVFRRIPIQIVGIDQLELPRAIRELTQIPDGLVLVTGPTGSGKSTTLAAMISEIADKEPLHIVTIEDPIEFLFIDKTAAISQREIGTDTPSFREALRNAMRQDPDVIMVGEMRDVETMSTVISAAETGHLVFSTLHTNNAAQTIDRIIDGFPPDQHKQIRSQLGLVLRGIVSLKLVKTKEGKLTAAVEVLKNSPQIAKMIEEGHTKDILDAMESSVGLYKMQSMNQSLIALLAHQKISYEDAMALTSDSDDLSLKLRKLFPQIEERIREGGGMAPSYSDFSQITELMDIKRLYEEQEVQWQQRFTDKEQEIENLKRDIEYKEQQLNDQQGSFSAKDDEIARLRADMDRLRTEAQAKIMQAQERIKELNQKLMASGGTSTIQPGVKR
jgi:twitching motility protein PilT